jgi:ankyrin repeat protein
MLKQFPIGGVYIYITKPYSSIKSKFIMKKTLLTTAAVFLLAAGGMYATNTITPNEQAPHHFLLKNNGLNSFCKAIVNGDIETVQKLISLGEDVNQKSLGMTPAIVAARYNKAEILEILIAHGANLKIKSDKGYTALKTAEMSNAMEALQVIQDAVNS